MGPENGESSTQEDLVADSVNMPDTVAGRLRRGEVVSDQDLAELLHLTGEALEQLRWVEMNARNRVSNTTYSDRMRLDN